VLLTVADHDWLTFVFAVDVGRPQKAAGVTFEVLLVSTIIDNHVVSFRRRASHILETLRP